MLKIKNAFCGQHRQWEDIWIIKKISAMADEPKACVVRAHVNCGTPVEFVATMAQIRDWEDSHMNMSKAARIGFVKLDGFKFDI